MTGLVVQTLDNRQQVLLDGPGEIQAGDWLRDLGVLRQVESIEELGAMLGPGVLYILHFVPQPGVEDRALGLAGSTSSITVWREL
jgi:hypothetical protein